MVTTLMSVKALNDYVGALLLSATIALFTFSIVGYAKLETMEVRVMNLEQMQDQQRRINESVAKLSETVAVIQDRSERE
jgi:hypothetical protein